MVSISEMEDAYRNMKRIEHSNVPVSKIKRAPEDRANPRDNSKAVPVVAKSLRDFGYVKTSITVDEDWEIITGDTTYQAHVWNDNLRASQPDLPEEEYEKAENRFDGPNWQTVIQVTQIIGMPDYMKVAYRIADNKSHEFADWRPDIVIRDIEFIMSKGMNPNTTSFTPRELSQLVKSVPDLTKDRKMSSTNAGSIEDYEGAKPKERFRVEESPDAHDEESLSSGDKLDDDEASWIVHLALSTKEAAEEFVRSNGFDLKYPPNSRMLSVDLSELE